MFCSSLPYMCYAHCIVVSSRGNERETWERTGGNEGKIQEGTSFIGGKQQPVLLSMCSCLGTHLVYVMLVWLVLNREIIVQFNCISIICSITDFVYVTSCMGNRWWWCNLIYTNMWIHLWCICVYRRKRRNIMRKNFRHWRFVTLLFFTLVYRFTQAQIIYVLNYIFLVTLIPGNASTVNIFVYIKWIWRRGWREL